MQELGALDLVLARFHDEFLGLANHDPSWINPEAVWSYTAADAVGDASLFPASVWEQSDSFPDYVFCRSVWTAAGNWQEQERFAASVPSWQEGILELRRLKID